jgi:uncharacterized protein YjeT (DUF2065 family)
MWLEILEILVMVFVVLAGLLFTILPGRARALEAGIMGWFIRGYEIPSDGPLLNRDSFYRIRGLALLAFGGLLAYMLFFR